KEDRVNEFYQFPRALKSCGRASLSRTRSPNGRMRNSVLDVREMIRKEPILDRSVISASVMPSAKYSCSGSWEGFSNGNTAIELIRLGSTHCGNPIWRSKSA